MSVNDDEPVPLSRLISPGAEAEVAFVLETDLSHDVSTAATRLMSEELTWIRSRSEMRRSGDKIARRRIFLEETLLLSHNLSDLF